MQSTYRRNVDLSPKVVPDVVTAARNVVTMLATFLTGLKHPQPASFSNIRGADCLLVVGLTSSVARILLPFHRLPDIEVFMNAVADALEAQLSLVDWFKRIEPLAARSASRALATFSSSKTGAAKTYSSMANLSYQVDRKGLLVDRNV